MSGIVSDRPLDIAVPQFASVEDRELDWRYISQVAAGSLILHVLLGFGGVGLIGVGPSTYRAGDVRPVEIRRQSTPLVAPPSLLTQRAPNRRDVSKEFDLASLPPRAPQPAAPASPGAAALPRQRFRLPPKRATGTPSSSMTEAPALDLRASNSPPPPLGVPIPAPPPPAIEPQEKPKIAFERPGVNTGTSGPAGVGRVAVPKPASSVEEAVRRMPRTGGGLIVGDEDAGSAGVNPSAPSVPVPGKLGSAVELLSDPMGVDFWPYLVKVLSTVRRNWFAVIPESARLGRQGRTVIQFAIARDGAVPKLVIAAPSGTEALDRAAVAGVSASNPFPPLPSDFKGSQIRLQFVFKYNVR